MGSEYAESNMCLELGERHEYIQADAPSTNRYMIKPQTFAYVLCLLPYSRAYRMHFHTYANVLGREICATSSASNYLLPEKWEQQRIFSMSARPEFLPTTFGQTDPTQILLKPSLLSKLSTY